MIYFNNREKTVLIYLALGMSCNSIAKLLNINYKTVSCYKSSAFIKIGIRRNAQFVTWLRTSEAHQSITAENCADSSQ